MGKITQVKITDLKTTFFVRTGLDPEHVLKLADLYMNGQKLPPIKITSNREVIDGRHRLEAQELAFSKDATIDVEIIQSNDPLELIATALQSNEGGPLPSTRADIIHTIGLMLNRDAADRVIFDKLDFLPRGVVRKYMDVAKINHKKRLIQQARVAVADGISVREASERFGVELRELKSAISGPKVKSDSSGLEKLTSTVSSRFYAFNRSNQAMVKRVITGYSDGDVPEKTVEAVLSHIEKLQNIAIRRSRDWRKRFEAAKTGQFFSWNEIASPKDDISEEEAA